jgi:hypothetical protein
MIDYFNIPNNELSTQIFYSVSSGATSTNEWQIWQKPKNCKFVYFFVIGGGAGGGGGRTAAPGNDRFGGGGGGSSPITKGIFPANVLPDILFVKVGRGGNGGTGGNSGSAGSFSYVSLQPNTSDFNIVLASGNLVANGVPTGGGPGTTSAGLAGTFGVAFSKTDTIFGFYGVILSESGKAAVLGGNSITPEFITCGGAGGGRINGANTFFNAGQVNQTLFTPIIPAGVNGGGAGNNGIYSMIPSINSNSKAPMYFTGGSGGGANSSGTGGRGGDGSYGSGGGGGGGSTTGGTGGKGGDGLIIITSL